MRISSWFLGLMGFAALIVFTGLCSIVSFGAARTAVIGLWESGQQVESPQEIVAAIVNPDDFSVTAIPTLETNNGGIITIPSPTAFPTVAPSAADATAIPTQAATQSQTLSATAIPTEILPPTATPLPQELQGEDLGPREMNILLMGIDQRVGYTTDSAYRTDSMIVIHIDPVRRSVGVISFPRDLWVDIPGYNTQERINTANLIGDTQAYPGGGGPALAADTINANFGIRIDYYLMVNFTVFEAVVDIIAPEGIPVEVSEVIDDPDYPDVGFGTIHVHFDPGLEYMSGERLLQYARNRATQGGDLDRARRQQQVMDAIREYVLSVGGVQSFITRIPALWEELSGSYRTNLTLSQIISLGYLMNDISGENIRYRVVDAGYVQLAQNANGDQILLPIHSDIQRLIQETFYSVTDFSSADLRSRAIAENATIRVYNGTNIAGLAGRTQEFLLGQGVRISEIGNMPTSSVLPTRIRNYGGGEQTALWIAELLGLPASSVELGTDGLVANGVVVVAGSDIETLIQGR